MVPEPAGTVSPAGSRGWRPPPFRRFHRRLASDTVPPLADPAGFVPETLPYEAQRETQGGGPQAQGLPPPATGAGAVDESQRPVAFRDRPRRVDHVAGRRQVGRADRSAVLPRNPRQR